MARIKSETLRAAILAAAREEIAARGYQETTIAHIAKRAGTVASNVYSYYGSKLEVYFAIYEPWFRAQFEELGKKVETADGSVADRLELLARGVLLDIAGDHSGLTAALAVALATARPSDDYRTDLLTWGEEQIEHLARGILRHEHFDDRKMTAFVRTLMVLFDGIALRSHVTEPPEIGLLLMAIVPVLTPDGARGS
ncbi:TetR/AcrR family transcriptional regulator [Paracoccus sp. IB05]|uniref:TetR/AcrR family transcriptional regulator n=1 Tax=Paracoccus sp. IB05 TaxID=2779367 RepID=UPI0018E712BC|nr:TetR/AcrR family transcriptional regulator [Paracoccus sp. IB05]MBJ2151601.1 TetR/AcrR family transcriptional regulator [Paracoccus sp. IB05]